MMIHNLNALRHDVGLATGYINWCESLNFSEETLSSFNEYLAKAKHRLLVEMQRVSILLWPKTGRPYDGEWVVMNRRNELPVITGTQTECVKFIQNRCTFNTRSMLYYITKWPN
jgi:hypothetical protein